MQDSINTCLGACPSDLPEHSLLQSMLQSAKGTLTVYDGTFAAAKLEMIVLSPVLQYTHVGRALGLTPIVVVLLLLSRAIFCFPVLLAHNRLATEKVTWKEMFIAWCAWTCIAAC